LSATGRAFSKPGRAKSASSLRLRETEETDGQPPSAHQTTALTNPVPASSVIFDGSTIKIVFDAIRATYENTLNEARNSFKGTLTQGSPLPFDLDRATKDSSWRRDRTPHKIRFVTDTRM